MYPLLSTAAALLAWPQTRGVPAVELAGFTWSVVAGWLGLTGLLVAVLTVAWCAVRVRRHRRELRALTEATEELAGMLTRPLSERDHARLVHSGSAVDRLREALERVSIALLQSRQAHRQLDAVLGSMTASVIVVEADGEHVRSINGAGRSLLGVEELDLRGAGLESLFGVETDVVRGLMKAAAAGDGFGPGNLEVDLHSRDGRSSCVILSTAAVPDQEGRVEAYVVIAQEIGDLRRIEDRLHKINVRLWLTNELTAIALRIPDLEPAAEQIAQALRDSECFRAAGLAILESDEDRLRLLTVAGFGGMRPEGARSLARSFLSTVLEHQEPILLHNQEGRFDFDDPLLGAVEASVFGVFPLVVASRRIGLLFLATQENPEGVEDFGHAGNDLARHIAPLIDQKLTNERLRHSNQELHEARVAAEEASRAKSDFLANMSHEIRTPMTAILGYADLVRDGGLAAADADEFVRTIRRNGEHLLSIINDILDISKIEAGMMTIERVPCSPVRIACDVVEMMGRRARDKGLELELDLQWPLPRRVLSDPTRLRQVLSNLVGNAVKFTQAGSVRLSVRRAESSPERLAFEVRDTGIGLSGTELTRIFRPFSQADTSHTRRFGGTGLGLTISQRLANLLGGGIGVQSRKGMGSTFRLEIDGGLLAGKGLADSLEALETSERERDGEPAGHAGGGEVRRVVARVLLAEDGPDNQRLISFVLKKAGIDIDVVSDGKQAFEAALAAVDQGQPYDVILMDMQMPVLDGYAATSSLRAEGYTAPIVALTAHAMAGDKEKCLGVGCDAFLTKPIDRRLLVETIAGFAQVSR